MATDLTPNYLNQLIAERDENMSRFRKLAEKYKAYKPDEPFHNMPTLTYIPIGLVHRLSECIARIKVLNQRIYRLGEKYSIVKVKGKYMNHTTKLSILKSFELYYTEISEYDATCKARILFKNAVTEIHTQIIPTGKDVSFNFFK